MCAPHLVCVCIRAYGLATGRGGFPQSKISRSMCKMCSCVVVVNYCETLVYVGGCWSAMGNKLYMSVICVPLTSFVICIATWRGGTKMYTLPLTYYFKNSAKLIYLNLYARWKCIYLTAVFKRIAVAETLILNAGARTPTCQIAPVWLWIEPSDPRITQIYMHTHVSARSRSKCKSFGNMCLCVSSRIISLP